MKKILTISVAAYNLETMIEQNLESFVNCKNKEMLEVIVTDDGSKDKTAEIVEKYEKKYPDIFKLVKQENSGAGSTVNSGIKHATGKYFKMVDGDDWVVSENMDVFLENLSKIDADIVLTNTLIYNEKEQKIVKAEKPLSDMKEASKTEDFNCICNDFINMQMQFVTYKTSILKEKNIKLNNGFYTDVEYLLLPVPFINKIKIYDLGIYVYRIAREGQSVSVASRKKNIKMHDLVLKRLIEYYENEKENLDENARVYMAQRIASMEDMQLGTMLALKSSAKDIKEYNKKLKTLSSDIYKIYSKKSKCLLLTKSNYLLTKMLSCVFLFKNKE